MRGKDDDVASEIALERLLSSLQVESISDNRFSATAPPGSRRRIFGGVMMGQAITAAAIAVARPDLTLRSLHCTFVRSGVPGSPVTLRVVPAAGGRTSATCRVEATQDGSLLSTTLVRFHAAEPGPEHRTVNAPTDLPAPESIADYPTVLAPHRALVPDWQAGDLPIDVRMMPGSTDRQVSWIRAAGRLGDDALTHSCVMTYASDMTLLGTAALPFGRSWASPGTTMATLDHTMWFHRPFRGDEWMIYDQRVVAVAGGRALVTGSIFTADGDLAITVTQDGVVRFED